MAHYLLDYYFFAYHFLQYIYTITLITMTKIKLILLALLLSACAAHRQAVTDNAPKAGTFTDERDGQTYQWIRIGKQVWMAQNLNFKTPKGSYAYDNNPANRDKYGLLYDYPTLIDACPKGWHLPSDAEWQELEVSAGMSWANAKSMNFRGDIGAALLPGGKTGFNLLYAGWHKPGSFEVLGETAYFWTSTQSDAPVYARMFKRGYNAIYRNRFGIAYAMSVRCVKDEEPASK